MSLLSFDAYALWLNALIFLLAAGTIWWAGVLQEDPADMISERTGMLPRDRGVIVQVGSAREPL